MKDDANGKCRGCGKPVLFVEDDNGKRQILDVIAPVYHVSPAGGLCRRAGAAFVSHFATCPKASQFSKKKSGPV